MTEHPQEPIPILTPRPTLLERLAVWFVLALMIGLGVILLTTALFIGGIILLAIAAILGARMLWRKITGGGGGGSQGRRNVRVIERR